MGANHRMLSTYLNAIIAAGFVIDELAEHVKNVPVYLVVRATRI